MSKQSDARASAAIIRRRNTTKACIECRRRRAKCNGQKPSCTRCLSKNITCSYTAEEDGRQPAPRSYVILLRERIELLEKTLKAHGIIVDSPLANKSGVRHKDPTFDPSLRHTHEHADHGAEVRFASDVDQLSATLQGALTLDDAVNFDEDGEYHYFGPTSGRLEFLDPEYSSSGAQDLITQTEGPWSRNIVHSKHYKQHTRHVLSVHLISQELRTDLEDLYFTWQHPWYPVVNRTLFKYSENTGGRYFNPLLLSCILAVGSRFSERLEVRTDASDSTTAGRIFLEDIEALLHDELRSPTLTTVQSFCVASQFYISIGADATGWLYQGIANRLALDMGFNVDPEHVHSLSEEEVQLRRQIYWALYCEDKLSASYTGRVCSILDCQGAVMMPSLPEGLKGNIRRDSADAYEDYVSHMQIGSIKLCHILEKIFLSLYVPKPLLRGMETAAFLTSCLLELKNWYYDLHSNLRIDRDNKRKKPPQVYTLHMVYRTAHILLAKYFLPGRSKPTTSVANDHDLETVQKAQTVCQEAAREICSLATKYQQTYSSFRCSPITATHCTLSAALVLLRAQETKDTLIPVNSVNVDLCLEVLKELSESWAPAKQIRTRLERLNLAKKTKYSNSEEHSNSYHGPDPRAQNLQQVANSDGVTSGPDTIDNSEVQPISMPEFETEALMDNFIGIGDLSGWDWGLQDLQQLVQLPDSDSRLFTNNTLSTDDVAFTAPYYFTSDEAR